MFLAIFPPGVIMPMVEILSQDLLEDVTESYTLKLLLKMFSVLFTFITEKRQPLWYLTVLDPVDLKLK